MTKAELVTETCEYLKESNIRKPVAVPKQRFTITDDEGHGRTFTVKGKEKNVLYTANDVRNILNALIEITLDTVKHGGYIYIPRIGTLKVCYRKERKVRIPNSRQWKLVPARYVPKIDFVTAIKDAARVYEAYLIEQGVPLCEEKPKRKRGRPKKDAEIEREDRVDKFGIPEQTVYDMYELDQDMIDEDDEDVT